jgi:hypothetical protein
MSRDRNLPYLCWFTRSKPIKYAKRQFRLQVGSIAVNKLHKKERIVMIAAYETRDMDWNRRFITPYVGGYGALQGSGSTDGRCRIFRR